MGIKYTGIETGAGIGTWIGWACGRGRGCGCGFGE